MVDELDDALDGYWNKVDECRRLRAELARVEAQRDELSEALRLISTYSTDPRSIDKAEEALRMVRR
jgi:anti-sigma factor RsiW